MAIRIRFREHSTSFKSRDGGVYKFSRWQCNLVFCVQRHTTFENPQLTADRAIAMERMRADAVKFGSEKEDTGGF